MQDRQKKVKRILQVQKQMHQIAEWKLAKLQQRGVEIDEAQVDVIRSLNDKSSFHGLFVDSMARKLNRLSKESDELAREQQEQAERVLAEARRAMTTERFSRKLDREQKRAAEKLRFRTILEAFIGRGGASSA
jgi:hypothetical protein